MLEHAACLHVSCTSFRPGYYLINVVLPLFLIISMAGMCFLFDVADIEGRVGVLLSLVLTVVAFKYVIAGFLPKTSAITLLDTYVLACLALLLALNVEAAVVSNIADRDYALYIDKWVGVAFVSSWAGLHIACATLAYMGVFQPSWAKVQAHASENAGSGAPRYIDRAASSLPVKKVQ